MSQSRHSLRTVPSTRSHRAFALGRRGGFFKTRSPSRWMEWFSSAEKMLSRSCSRYAYRSSCPTASRSCCSLDDDEHVQDSERAGHRDTKITSDNGPCMIAKEGRPSLISARPSWRRVAACTCPPCVVTLAGQVSTAIRSRCALDPMLDSLAPFVGSDHVALSESVAALTGTSTATTVGSPLAASQ
jgi:hypothetical protein